MRKALLFTFLLILFSIGLAASSRAPVDRPTGNVFEFDLSGISDDSSPVLRMEGNTIMMAAKKAAAMLGAQLSWDPGTKSMSAVLGRNRLDMTVGRQTAVLNGSSLPLPAAPYLDHDELFVPLYAFCESFRSYVHVDNIHHKVLIIPGS